MLINYSKVSCANYRNCPKFISRRINQSINQPTNQPAI